MVQRQQQEKIGQGAFSVAYRSKTKTGEKSYIVKKPNPLLQKEKLQILPRKYRHQKQVMDILHRENPTKSGLFGQIYQVNQKGQSIMKDLGDTDLWKLFQQNRNVVSLNVGPIIEQLIDAMLTMIKSNIVHLDIKPENIMAHYDEKSGKVAISFIDFADSVPKQLFEKHPKFKITGTSMYMSPELLSRSLEGNDTKGEWKEYIANDLWSLGIVIYILLYGKLPFDMFRSHCTDPKLKRYINTPWKLYDELKENPELHNRLFPLQGLAPEKRKYVKLVKTLLSMDPEKRLQWLVQKQRQSQQQKTKSSQMSLTKTQQKKR